MAWKWELSRGLSASGWEVVVGSHLFKVAPTVWLSSRPLEHHMCCSKWMAGKALLSKSNEFVCACLGLMPLGVQRWMGLWAEGQEQ